ncbi:MAG: aminotransferase class I/II-fold pyridoxal phosphate-dependent enzyme, partial [Gammaproteobacteria bacterium]|nr:aminotransferase class I/II-fold pyridoxal phosphate-dependent enzyme [Gammaproteobacteria bacterium]
MERINVTKAYLPNQKRLIEYIDQIYESGQMTNYGPLVQTLERRLAQHLGVRHVVLVANGTLALQVAFKALKLQGSVITTPFSFPATTSALVWESLKPIFVDIDSLTWNLNPAHILDAVQSDTTAILPVHVFGNPCEVKAISDLAKELNLKVIYDAAHAFEVQYQSESVLKWGDLSILSFHATKLFHTIEGGALITENDELAEQLRSMINFGF